MAMNGGKWLRIDPFLLLLVATVALASLLPVHGVAALWAGRLTNAAIALLFFMHGAKLSGAAITQGLTAWRIHLVVMASTFLVFPALGLSMRAIAGPWVDPTVTAGLLFFCLLPSTVQSSIAFTSIAGGNVSAAVCSASLSNLAGMVLTPLLVATLMGAGAGAGGVSAGMVVQIALQLLLPFVAGHLSRPWLGSVIDRHKQLVGRTDRGSILLVVYTAFSAAVVQGLWRRVGIADLGTILLLDASLLVAVLCITWACARLLGFARQTRSSSSSVDRRRASHRACRLQVHCSRHRWLARSSCR
nr:bile acid:sodium symporter family protein [Sphingomonas nostoxanthinifaciens]